MLVLLGGVDETNGYSFEETIRDLLYFYVCRYVVSNPLRFSGTTTKPS